MGSNLGSLVAPIPKSILDPIWYKFKSISISNVVALWYVLNLVTSSYDMYLQQPTVSRRNDIFDINKNKSQVEECFQNKNGCEFRVRNCRVEYQHYRSNNGTCCPDHSAPIVRREERLERYRHTEVAATNSQDFIRWTVGWSELDATSGTSR